MILFLFLKHTSQKSYEKNLTKKENASSRLSSVTTCT